jgi:hypothetical protein
VRRGNLAWSPVLTRFGLTSTTARWLGLSCLSALCLGALLGTLEPVPWATVSASARVGQVLAGKRQPDENFARDAELVKVGLHGPARGTFELLLALRGWKQRGEGALDEAVRTCQRAQFARCERRALEQTARELTP